MRRGGAALGRRRYKSTEEERKDAGAVWVKGVCMNARVSVCVCVCGVGGLRAPSCGGVRLCNEEEE